MRILNVGSLNIDHVYAVDHFVQPGETLASTGYRVHAGGKGCNQSIALAAADAPVAHIGRLGADGVWLRDMLAVRGVDTTGIEIVDGASGHAVIQVDAAGENAILLAGGANVSFTDADAAALLASAEPGDWLLLQNEISAIPAIMREAIEREMRIAFNPAPMGPEVHDYPLDLVDLLIVNEIEGTALSDYDNPEDITESLQERFATTAIVLTLGSRGVRYHDGDGVIEVPSPNVAAVDTTAAGDCFIGYLLAGITAGRPVREALTRACAAASLCVTRAGAADSIPLAVELDT